MDPNFFKIVDEDDFICSFSVDMIYVSWIIGILSYKSTWDNYT